MGNYLIRLYEAVVAFFTASFIVATQSTYSPAKLSTSEGLTSGRLKEISDILDYVSWATSVGDDVQEISVSRSSISVDFWF